MKPLRLRASRRTPEYYIARVRSLPFFSLFSDSELARLEPFLHLREIEPDEILFKDQAPGYALYFLVDGQIIGSGSGQAEQTMFTSGHLIGEAAFLNPELTRDITLVAKKKSVLYAMFRYDLDHLETLDPKVCAKVYKELARYLSLRWHPEAS